MAKRKPGRPALPPDEAMSKQITCRVRPSEEAAMKAVAEARGLTLAEWMRQTLTAAAKRSATRSTKKKGRRRKTT